MSGWERGETIEYAGEVIESSTSELVAEARELDRAPAFGSLVHVEAGFSTVGVVFNVSTQSIEPGRKAMAFGMSADDLRMQQPQIFELFARPAVQPPDLPPSIFDRPQLP